MTAEQWRKAPEDAKRSEKELKEHFMLGILYHMNNNFSL